MASEAIDSWQYAILDFNFSSEQFYKLVGQKISLQEIPKVKMKMRNIRQGGWFSKRRLYLEVRSKRHIFHICAAPYGKSYFFSWYLRVKMSFFREWLTRWPIVGKWFLVRMKYQPYYKLDTANMFKLSIKHCIDAAIQEVTDPSGLRRGYDQGNEVEPSQTSTDANTIPA